MSNSTPNGSAIITKALLLLQKIKQRILQIDDTQFPTEFSSTVKNILVNVLDNLSEAPKKWDPSPTAFHRQVLQIQELVNHLERSSNDYVLWPVVNYFNSIWLELFEGGRVHVFFSQSTQHNYSIYNFSDKLFRKLNPIIPEAEIQKIIDSEIYCLQLASLEEDNIPLYANVAHEFGHVVYNRYQSDIADIWSGLNKKILEDIKNEIENEKNLQPQIKARRNKKILAILTGFIKEITSDIVGALLLGPNFFLSLYEMSWGFNNSNWYAILTPALQLIKSYPSFNFRLEGLRKIAHLDEFCSELNAYIVKHDLSTICKVPDKNFLSLALSKKDEIIVSPESDSDSVPIKKILDNKMEDIKVSIKNFQSSVSDFLIKKLSKSISNIDPSDISELILRLHQRIPPNIIPNGSVFGKPAEFPSILLAASIYRLSLLSNNNLTQQMDTINELDRIERLTGKAFEVSYIQKEFKEWKKVERNFNGNTS